MRRVWVAGSAALVLTLGGVLVGLSTASWPSKQWLERGYYMSQILLLLVTTTAAILVYGQVSGIRETLRRGDFDSTSGRILRMSELLLNHPQEYLQLANDTLSGSSQALAEALLDLMDTELLRTRAIPSTVGRGVPSLETYFADLLNEVPGLCTVLKRRAAWYSEQLTALSPSSSAIDIKPKSSEQRGTD